MSWSILSDREIRELCEREPPMIAPFVPRQEGKPSYGLGSFGYDIRLGKKFLVPLGGVNAVLDPVDFPKEHFRQIVIDPPPRHASPVTRHGYFELAPHSQVLAESVEWFHMPDDVMGVCWGKSSYARCGLLVNVTPLECFDDQTEILTLEGWKGFEDLAEGEIVATLSKDGVLEYHPIIARQKRWYEGELIAIKGRSIDLLVTPEHRLYVRRQGKSDFELLQAGALEGEQGLVFKRGAILSNKGQKHPMRLSPPDEIQESAWSRVPYKGYVYDVTVPPNHTIYVRRNGKAVWSGNCGWRGILTIELANLSPLPIRLHVGQGIAQVVFFRGRRPQRAYGEKEAGGVYQDQPGVTLPR